jgi:sugar lactone lactonase YvrE
MMKRRLTAAALAASMLTAGFALAQSAGSTLAPWRQYTGVSWDAPASGPAARFAGSTSAPIVGLRFDATGKAYVSTPRLISGQAPATISVLDLASKDSVARLAAFPSLAANDSKAPASEALRSVLGFHVDHRNGWLWALDAGYVAGESEAPTGGQKLMVYELAGGKLVKRIPLDGVADRKGSFLNDIAVDEARKIAYISDSGLRSAPANQAGIIVIDFKAGSARRVLDRHPSVLPGDDVKVMSHGEEVWPGNPLKVGINGIALSADGATLYWTVTAGTKLWSAPAGMLRNPKVGGPALAAAVRNRGTVGGNTDGIVTAPDGQIYITDVSRNGIARFNPWDGKMSLAASDERISWPDTAAVGPGKAIYFTVSSLNNHFAGAVKEGQERYEIWRLPLDR